MNANRHRMEKTRCKGGHRLNGKRGGGGAKQSIRPLFVGSKQETLKLTNDRKLRKVQKEGRAAEEQETKGKTADLGIGRERGVQCRKMAGVPETLNGALREGERKRDGLTSGGKGKEGDRDSKEASTCMEEIRRVSVKGPQLPLGGGSSPGGHC